MKYASPPLGEATSPGLNPGRSGEGDCYSLTSITLAQLR